MQNILSKCYTGLCIAYLDYCGLFTGNQSNGVNPSKDAEEICKKLTEAGLRASVDPKSHSISKKVREAQLAKVNYMVTLGDKEVEKKTLSIRTRDGKVKFDVKVEDFIKDLKKEVEEKSK